MILPKICLPERGTRVGWPFFGNKADSVKSLIN
jgi:hypothetical protein